MLFQIGVYFVYIPWNVERLQISESELGLGLLVFGISNLISNQISGRYIVPNIGTKNSMSLGLLIIAFCPLILVSAPNYLSFLLAYIPLGIGVGLFHPSAQSQISMIENKTSRIITPVYQAAFSTGSLIGAIAAAFFIKNIYDPGLIFLLSGLLLTLGSIAIFRLGLVKNLEILEKTPRFRLPKNNILIFGFLLMMNYATMGIILDWSALWLTSDLLAPLFIGGIIIIVFNIGEIISRLLASKLIKRSSERFVGGYLSIFSGIILFFCIMTTNLYVIVVGMVIFGFGTANFPAIVIRQAINITDEPIHLTVSNLVTLGFAGFIFGPALVGYLAEYLGLTFNMYLLSVIWGLNGVALLAMMRRIKYS
jgi:predicted MFS family arabinose efflux permease